MVNKSLNRRLLIVALCILLTASCTTISNDNQSAGIIAVPMPELTVVEPSRHGAPYNREEWQPHGWADEDSDGCNTRKEVLIQESLVPIETGTKCAISKGKWRDRFQQKEFDDPDALQIDHLVALADANRSGGWRWSNEKKQSFANNLKDPDELNAIEGDENQKKSDHGPDKWVPKDAAAKCRYIEAYARIKHEWGLTVTKSQLQAIQNIWKKCDSS